MGMQSKGRKIHAKAAEAREAGESLKALQLEDEALLAYQEDNDDLGFAELQAERRLVLNHLNEKSDYAGFLILAKYSALASVELAEASGDKNALAIPYFNLAKSYEVLGQLDKAVEFYKMAVENQEQNSASMHDRPAVLLDMKIHLVAAEYKAGEKSKLEEAEQLINELDGTEEEGYNKLVWLSGAHMRMAEMLKEDNLEKAKDHLQKAKDIIDSDARLKIRASQWEKLAKNFA